jgi:DNA-directed RNA polymerase I, II, and III subunit RPABC2
MSKLNTVNNLEEKDGESVVSDETSDNDSDYEDKDEPIEDDVEEEDDDDDEEEEDMKDDNESVKSVDITNILGEDANDENESREQVQDMDIEEVDHSFQKLEDYMILSDLEKLHPESQCVNFDEVAALTRVVRDSTGKIIDPLHKTAPFITKYERARIIGSRAEQIERGAKPFVEVEANIINARTIAMMEYDQKIIPFIIARPLPNKTIEYWRLQDLEYI